MKRAANLPRNADGEKPPNTARHLKIVRLIQVSHSFRGFPPLESSEAARQASIWDAVGLNAIPEADLADCFTLAMERLGDGDIFGAPQVREAWKAIGRNRQYETPVVEDSRYCPKCAQLSGLYWDPNIGKFRCCECDGGRTKAAAIGKRGK